MPEQVPDDITSCFNNYPESASSQTRPVLPVLDSSNEHTYPPLAQSAPIPTGPMNKTVIFNSTPGYEHSQGSKRQSYAQAAGSNHPDSN